MNTLTPIKQHHSIFSYARQAIDATVIGALFWLCASLHNMPWTIMYKVAMIITVLIYLSLARHKGLYESWNMQSVNREALQILGVWSTVVFAVALLAFALKVTDYYSRVAVVSWIITAPAGLILYRLVLRYASRWAHLSGLGPRRVVIAGVGPLGIALAKMIKSSPWMGIRIAGFYDDGARAELLEEAGLDIAVVGDLDQLAYDALTGEYDAVYVALPMRAEARMKSLIRALADGSVSVHYVPDVFTFNLFNSRIHDVGGIPTISVYDSPLDGAGQFVKRAEDMVLSAVFLCLLALPMLVIAVAIKFDSPGPVFFKQLRYGLRGEKILVWKFRSMVAGEGQAEFAQAVRNDPRVTRLGFFLRKTSLDELPQLFNVFDGTMSIVGPRPHPVSLNEQYRREIDGYMLRHMVKPGITGWAQVNGWRGETDTLLKMEKRVEFDLHYLRNWSVFFDLKIIFLTLLRGFNSKNAY